MRNSVSCIDKNKGANQLCSHCTADKHICFATCIILGLFFLALKFLASSLLLSHYSLICVGPGQNPEDHFSCVVAHPIDEPLHEKTNNLHRRKQRRRSASR